MSVSTDSKGIQWHRYDDIIMWYMSISGWQSEVTFPPKMLIIYYIILSEPLYENHQLLFALVIVLRDKNVLKFL